MDFLPFCVLEEVQLFKAWCWVCCESQREASFLKFFRCRSFACVTHTRTELMGGWIGGLVVGTIRVFLFHPFSSFAQHLFQQLGAEMDVSWSELSRHTLTDTQECHK